MSKNAEKEGLERIEVDIEDPHSSIVRTAAFTGRWLVRPSEDDAIDGYIYSVALTGRGRIAVWISRMFDPGQLYDFDDLDEMESCKLFTIPEVVIADARGALTGSTPVVELDI